MGRGLGYQPTSLPKKQKQKFYQTPLAKEIANLRQGLQFCKLYFSISFSLRSNEIIPFQIFLTYLGSYNSTTMKKKIWLFLFENK